MPAWFAAAVKVSQRSVTGEDVVKPGSIFDDPTGKVTEAPNLSLPVNSLRAAAPAVLKVLCPEMYSAV